VSAARLAAVVLLALALAPQAHARSDAPRLKAPEGLRAFLLRADEPKTDVYPRTPSFAWRPASRTLRYEFQLSTSNLFRDSGIVYSNREVKTPALSVPLSLPWITGKPYALYARVRAVTQLGTTPWTEPFGFNMRWPTVPEPMSTFPGLLRWTPVPGATGYQVWFGEARKVISTATNVADQREYYTFHQGTKWTSSLRWRVRAVRVLYGTRANSLPAVSYGPWSQIYTAVNPPFAVGTLGLMASVSDTVADATSTDEAPAHSLMPGFVFTGNRPVWEKEPEPVELYRAYAFTDSDCVNVVFRGAIVGSPAFAPRTTGSLELPDSFTKIAAARNKYLGDLAGKSGPTQLTVDGVLVTPNEDSKPAAETEPAEDEKTQPEAGDSGDGGSDQPSQDGAATGGTAGAGTSLPADQTVPIPPVDLWDTEWPQGGYYWTVVGVIADKPEPFETTLGASAAVGATTIDLVETAGLEEGNKLKLGTTGEEVVIASISGDTVTLVTPLTAAHSAGDVVVRSTDSALYKDIELPQDVCAAGRVLRFGKMSEPAVAIAGAPLVSGLSTTGRLISATRTEALFYGPPVVAWNPAAGAHGYEVQWSKKAGENFEPAAQPIFTFATSAVLPLKPGTWYYRVRGLNLSLPKGAQPLSWSEAVKVVVAKPRFTIVKK
jgi:hypothetical protein